jgi:hypothetical protein
MSCGRSKRKIAATSSDDEDFYVADVTQQADAAHQVGTSRATRAVRTSTRTQTKATAQAKTTIKVKATTQAKAITDIRDKEKTSETPGKSYILTSLCQP